MKIGSALNTKTLRLSAASLALAAGLSLGIGGTANASSYGGYNHGHHQKHAKHVKPHHANHQVYYSQSYQYQEEFYYFKKISYNQTYYSNSNHY